MTALSNLPERRAYSVSEVAVQLGVSEASVRRAIDAGDLQASRPFPGRVLITVDAVEAFLRSTHEAKRS